MNKKERLAAIIVLIFLYYLLLDNIINNKLLIIAESIRHFLRFFILEAAIRKDLFRYFSSLILNLIYTV